MSSAALPTDAAGRAAFPAWQRALLFAVAYFLVAEIGRFMSVRDSPYVSFWLPAGLYVAVLLLNQTRTWPWLVLAAFAGNLAFDLMHGTNLVVALLFCATNAVQSVSGAWLVRRYVAERPRLTTLKEFFGFMGLTAVLGNILGAALGAATLSAFGLSDSFVQSWKVWWGSNAMAILLLSPLLLTWQSGADSGHGRRAPPARILEAVAFVALSVGLTWHLLFADHGIMSPDKARMILPVLWAGLRFGPLGASAASLLLAVPVAFFTTQAFAGLTPEQIVSGEHVFVMQTSLAAAALIGLVPAIALGERDRKMQELGESEARLRLAVHASNVGLWIWNIAQDRLYLSPEWKDQLGYRDDEIPSRYAEWEMRLHPDDREAAVAKLKAYLAAPGPSYETEFRLRHRDGSYRWIYVRAQVECDAAGRPQRMLGCHIDITGRKRAEAGAAELAAIVQSSEDAIVSMAADGVILTWNKGAERLFGHPAQETIGRPISIVYPPGEEFVAQRNLEAIRQGERHYEAERRRRDGSAVPVSVTAFPIVGPAGDIAGIGAIYRDITQRKQSQEELRRSLTRLQELSRRLVEVEETERRNISRELHDRVGQNLAAINLSLGMIRSQLPGEALPAIGPRIDDGQTLLADTMSHVRNLMAELRPVALDDYGLFAALRTHAAEFSKRFGTDVRVIGSDSMPRLPLPAETALFRIAQEALNNVAKHARATKVDILLDEANGSTVLSITDNGTGFDASKQRLEKPSWGMTTMRERAEAVGATLTIDSTPGRGTRIEAAMPRGAA